MSAKDYYSGGAPGGGAPLGGEKGFAPPPGPPPGAGYAPPPGPPPGGGYPPQGGGYYVRWTC